MSDEENGNWVSNKRRRGTEGRPGSAQLVYHALRDLSVFAEREVASGGANLQNDPLWEERAISLLDHHASWARAVGLPEPSEGPEWDSSLVRWAGALPYASAPMGQVAAWVCHAVLVRDLHDWTEAITDDFDAHWPPNPRPHNMEIDNRPWRAAAGDTVDDGWIVALSEQFVRMFPAAREEGTLPALFRRRDDVVGALPGLIVVAWLHRSWRWRDYERHIAAVLGGAS